MGVPSVMKIKKGEIEFESKCDLAKYTISELTRRALMDVGRYVTYGVRKQLRLLLPFTKHHRATERYQYWVPRQENCLVLGIENRKRGAKTAWWADQLELDKFVVPPRGKGKAAAPASAASASKMDTAKKPKARAARKSSGSTGALGTAHAPRRHLLEKFVKGHIDRIVEIESQYLAKINDEDAAVALARAAEDMEVMRGDAN